MCEYYEHSDLPDNTTVLGLRWPRVLLALVVLRLADVGPRNEHTVVELITVLLFGTKTGLVAVKPMLSKCENLDIVHI